MHVSEATPNGSDGSPSSFVRDRYRVERVLGEGATKRVYLVHDRHLDRQVAFAQLKADQLTTDSLERLHQEAQAMGRLGGHPNVVTIFDVGEDAGHPYIVSEYMAGGDVTSALRASEGRRFDIQGSLRIAADVCRALGHVHASGIIHRDVKPGNVWLTEDGTAKLGDFGLALVQDRTRLSQAGLVYGTPNYMAPERALGGDPDPRSDAYSLGVMLYEMVTGQTPFRGDDPVAVITQHIETAPVSPTWRNPNVPRALESLILRLLAKAPSERPQSIDEVLASIERIAAVAAPAGPDAASQDNPLDRLAGGVWVGREAEMGQLRAALDNAVAGHGRLVLVAGEPGIGKTRIVQELGTYAQLRGAEVLWGRCYEGEGAPPYWPWTQIVRAYVRDRDPESLEAELGPWRSDIAHVAPDLRHHMPGLGELRPPDSEQARFRVFESVCALLENASRRRPIVVVLDDLHVADQASLLLLRYFAWEVRDARMLVVGTYRDLDLHRGHPLAQAIGNLVAEHNTKRIVLGGISSDDVARFIELTAAIQAPAELVATVYRETEGNPFFVHEVVRLLVAEGGLERADDLASWTPTIPDNVREVVTRRLERLSPACNRFLTFACVMGREFDLAVLEHITEDSDELMEALDEAIAAQVVVEGVDTGHYRFSHALVQETLYAAIPTLRRARLHGKIGAALEVLARPLEAHLDELAHHFAAAAGTDGFADKGVDYATRAAAQASARLAYGDAVAHLERALAALDRVTPANDERRCSVLLALGEAAAHAGDPATARDAYGRAAELARARDDPQALARAALGYGGPWVTFGVSDEFLVQLLEEEITALGPADSGLRAMILARLAAELYFSDQAQRREALSREAVEMARRLAEPSVLAYTLNARHGALWGPENVEERLSVATEIVDLAERAGDRELAIHGRARRVVDLLELGDVAAMDREIEAHRELADALRDPGHQWYGLVWRAMRAQLAGRFEEAERFAGEAWALGRRLHESEAEQCRTAQVFLCRLEHGDVAELEGLIGQFSEQRTVPGWRAARAQLLSEIGREAEARHELAALASNDFRDLPRDNTWLPALALSSEAAALLRDTSAARTLYRLLMPYASRNVVAVEGWICFGAASRLLGLLAATIGDWEPSARHFEAAIEFNERIGGRGWLARTRYQYADMLVQRNGPGDHLRAAELLDEAIASAQELGMQRVLERAVALGARLRDPASI